MKFITNIVSWARPSLEKDGKANVERILICFLATFSYIPGRLYYMISVTDPYHLLYPIVIDAVFILILARIIHPKDIINLKDNLTITKQSE